jgi:hypothetical protein
VNSTSEPLKITLVWTDPPAEGSAGKALVNDLNLVVTSPGGREIYRGNANFVKGFSQPQTTPVADDPNNVEMVIVKDPEPGAWTARVEGRAVHIGRQGYALVASGSLVDTKAITPPLPRSLFFARLVRAVRTILSRSG